MLLALERPLTLNNNDYWPTNQSQNISTCNTINKIGLYYYE